MNFRRDKIMQRYKNDLLLSKVGDTRVSRQASNAMIKLREIREKALELYGKNSSVYLLTLLVHGFARRFFRLEIFLLDRESMKLFPFVTSPFPWLVDPIDYNLPESLQLLPEPGYYPKDFRIPSTMENNVKKTFL